MAEGKVDLARISQPKLASEAFGGKGVSVGLLDEEKVLVGLDDSKDQLNSENSIPLSPQWLYSKNSESKVGNYVASGDGRLQNSLPQGSSADPLQKDSWRLDGPPEKKEWRRNAPDIETSRRWRDEERETGLLGRRERRKEGDRESEYRKNDHRSDNVLLRDSSESRILSSDRWHEVTGRNTGYDSRRDSKWSSRWGPEEKDKESRAERKMEMEKDEFTEKQSFLGGTSRVSESDSREKWRPRHRQEAHSGGPSFRAAPGFGLDRGRTETLHAAFSAGRGRGSPLGGLTQLRPSSASPIGAAPLSRVDVDSGTGKPGLLADMFRYPRGKLLDIYRTHKMLPEFEAAPDGFEDSPSLTQPNSIAPLAFVSPNSDEEALLGDISEGKITGSGVSYSISREQNTRIISSEIGMDSEDKPDVIFSMAHDTSLAYPVISSVSAASSNDTVIRISGDPLFGDGNFDGMIYKVSDDPVIDHCQKEQKQHLGENSVVKDAEHLQFPGKDFVVEETVPAVLCDVSSKLPNDSSSLFEISFTEETPRVQGCDYTSREVEHVETISPEDLSFFYRDPQGDIQGPFLGVDIISWFEQGFFGVDLPVCLSDAPEGTPFQPLGEVMPQFLQKSSFSEPSDALTSANSKFMVNGSLASSHGGSVDASSRELMVADEFQPKILEFSGYRETPSEREQFSELNICANILPSQSQNLHDFAGADSEEVLYKGRRMNSNDKSLERFADVDQGLAHISVGQQFLAREVEQGRLNYQKNTRDNDMNALGLLWPELEGSNVKRPLSSNVVDMHDQVQIDNPSMGVETLYGHKQDFSSSGSHTFSRDAWPGAFSRSKRTNEAREALDPGHFLHFHGEPSHIGVEDQMLSHHFQQQHLQKHLPSHLENMHLNTPFVGAGQGSLHHGGSNQSLLDFEHLLKLQLQEQHHLRQLREHQQLQQQQKQLHQIQLLQQQWQQHQQQQQLQQEQQRQMLLEHLLRQQLHDPAFGASQVDQLLGNSSLDQMYLRQQLLRELEHQPHHIQRHQDPTLEQLIQANLGYNHHREHHNDLLDAISQQKHRSALSMEEQIFFNFQKDKMQAMQFPHASRLQRGLEEDRHGGGVWSVDESSQFLRRAAVPNQPHSSRNQLDFVQTLQQPPLFEHESVLERNLMLHDRIQHASYEPSMKHFDSSISHSPPGPNSDVLDALARLQGLDVSDICGRAYPSMQKRQLHPVSSSFEDRATNHHLIPGLDLIDSKWAESNGQLPNYLSEQQVNQLHFMAERQKMDMRGSLFNRESNAWEAFAGNDNPKNGIDEIFQQKLALQPSESFDIAAPSYEDQDSSWFTRSFDNSFKLAAEEAALRDSSTEGTITSKLAYFQQDGLKSANLERQTSKNDASGRLAIHSRSSLSAEQNQLFSEANEIEEHVADSVGNNTTLGDRVSLSVFKDELRLKNNSSKGKTFSNIDQAGGSLLDLGEVTANPPVRHSSLGSNAGAINFYGYELIPDSAYSEEITNSRSMSFLDRAESSSMKPSQDPQLLSAQQGSLFELVTAPTIKTKNPSGFQSAEGKGEAGGNGATTIVPGASSSIAPKDTRFRRTSSHDADAPEASFIDVIKNSTKKPATESEGHSGAPDLSETVHGAKSGKKKGKKGRQIDPSLLGFKVHSNRIMMGEIQRPDD